MSDSQNPVPAPAAAPVGSPAAAPVDTSDAAPVATTATTTSAPVVVERAPAPSPKKRRALGIAALVFALLCLVTDIVTLVFGFGSISQFSDGNIARGLGMLAGFFGYGLVAVVLGAVFAGIAFVLAIGALIGGSGRVAGGIALLISIGELIFHGIAIAVIIGIVTSIAGAVAGVSGAESLPLDQLIPGLTAVGLSL